MTTGIEQGETTAVGPAGAERQALIERWAMRHGVEAAARLAEAEDLADAVAREITPDNTLDTYAKSWRVWTRFCTAQDFPTGEGSRGALVAYVAWLLREGRQTPGPGGALGYAPASAETHLNATITELRERGHAVTRDAAAEARKALDGLTVKLLQSGQRRGRGQAPAADIAGMVAIAEATEDTLTGRRDLALVFTGFHYASRASEPAGLLLADMRRHAKGLIVDVLTGKTKHSVRQAKIPYARDPRICPVRAWDAWHEALLAEGAPYADPSQPAFRQIDRWGRLGGGLGPDGVTRAVSRISERSGVPIRWTGHSLRVGLASTGREQRKDAIAIADQGGWARHSRSMLGYMQRGDGWEDNASAGLA